MESLKTAIFREVRQNHEPSSSLNDSELNSLIFYNVTGPRLTFPGFLILKNIFTAYSFEMTTTLKARHHIGMSKMEYPFYINSRRLILFSEMDAMMIKLHGGIEGFLETCFNIDRPE
jgi:hypothetical protein